MEAYTPPRAPRSITRARRGLLLGLGGLAFAMIGVAVGGTMFARYAIGRAGRELEPVAERYLEKLRQGDYQGAYEELDAAMRASESEAEYESVERRIHEHIGQLKSKSVEKVEFGTDRKGRWGRLVYACQFESGPLTLSFDFSEVSPARWKIVGLHYDSHAVNDPMGEGRGKGYHDAHE